MPRPANFAPNLPNGGVIYQLCLGQVHAERNYKSGHVCFPPRTSKVRLRAGGHEAETKSQGPK